MQWHDVPNHPGYQVTKTGRMRSIDRYNTRGQWIKGKEQKTIKKYVARWILMTFDRMPEPEEMALHWDDDRSNNRLSNLRWGTARDNALDAVRNGIISAGSAVKKRHSLILKKLHRQGRYKNQPAKMRKVKWTKERREKYEATIAERVASS